MSCAAKGRASMGRASMGRIPSIRLAAWTAILILTGAMPGCSPAPESPSVAERESEPAGAGATAGVTRPDVGFVLDETAFTAPEVPGTMVPFDLVTADLELDGDPDLLVSWHNLAPLELFANQGGGFYLINQAGADRAGLYENPGIPSLYAATGPMVERARGRDAPGVYVWHEPNRRGDWQLFVVAGDEPVTLRVRGNGELTPRLDERFLQTRSRSAAEIRVDGELQFGVEVSFVASQLVVEASVPVFVGADMTEVGARADLWKDDPHGIAWIDALGSPEPDLFITRGGLMGSLQPPFDAKRDRFFEYTGGVPLYADVREIMPAGYGRGRRVEWVDVDADGVNELYIGNTDTPNELLSRGADGVYRDVAADLGLDFEAADVFAWLDVDDDGFDDLVFLDASDFRVALGRAGEAFAVVAGESLGLRLPAGAPAPGEELFSPMALNVLDFDSDGVLDLWLSGYGEDKRHALFRGAGGTYVDVTDDVGLGELSLSNRIVFLDIENDGYLDALSLGGEAVWLHNLSGRRFDTEPVEETWRLREFSHAMPLDADRDGLTDVVLVDRRRMIARNVSSVAGGALRVRVRGDGADPVGTVVTAVYSDGMRAAQRFGSASATKYSQGAAPLHFGTPAGNAIEHLEIRWPGGREATHAVAAEETTIELRR